MKKIVMIEDSKVLGTALSGALKIEGIEVFWAHKLSGFDVCKLLKTDNDTWRIPVIVMSTLSDPESQDRAKEAGADFFIPKPYDLADTLKEIKKHLN